MWFVNRSAAKLLFNAGAGFYFLFFATFASASVVTVGTRIIYPGDAIEKTFQLNNQDAFPNIVQIWADVKSPDSNPESADAPFFITPSVFRMEPKSGQSVRIRYTGEGLPQDRESVFYLNFQHIPSRNDAHRAQNQLVVMLRNQLKLFYRPAAINDSPETLAEKLSFNLTNVNGEWGVIVDNPTGYFASFSGGVLQSGGRDIPLKNGMAAPKSKDILWYLGNTVKLKKGEVTIRGSLINDHGARIELSQQVVVP